RLRHGDSSRGVWREQPVRRGARQGRIQWRLHGAADPGQLEMSQDPPVATFDPALPLDLDKMRDALGDINVEKPLFPDVTYEAKLAEAGGAWRLAAAAMARSLAARAAKQMESFSAGSQPAIAWGNRTR